MVRFLVGFSTMGENLVAVSFASPSAMPETDENKPEAEAPAEAAKWSSVPVINAGDGWGRATAEYQAS
jgi:hypothetical protein